MSFESMTLRRSGDWAYEVTIWSDGVVRWDGESGPRMGAWQASMDAYWMQAMVSALADLPPSGGATGDTSGSLAIKTSTEQELYSLDLTAERAEEVWCLGMLLDGVCTHLRWAPLDALGVDDFSSWANGQWMSFRQGLFRGEALARPDGLLLLAGSTASASTAAALDGTYKYLRESLIADGGLTLVGDVFMLTRHVAFAASSAAASVLAGSNTNGRRAWRNTSGTTWGDLGFA